MVSVSFAVAINFAVAFVFLSKRRKKTLKLMTLFRDVMS